MATRRRGAAGGITARGWGKGYCCGAAGHLGGGGRRPPPRSSSRSQNPERQKGWSSLVALRRCVGVPACLLEPARSRICNLDLTPPPHHSSHGEGSRLARTRGQGSRPDAQGGEAGTCKWTVDERRASDALYQEEGLPSAEAALTRTRLLRAQEKKKNPKGRAYKRLQVRGPRLRLTLNLSTAPPLALTPRLPVQPPLRERGGRSGQEEGAKQQHRLGCCAAYALLSEISARRMDTAVLL